ncbi:MAG: thioesterase [Burkholderiaceae bacterium]|nr:thioesterase [Burkholderiaceae bacterium]
MERPEKTADGQRMAVGLRASVMMPVGPEHTARHLGSGQRDVLATPVLVAWMESAAQLAVAASLPPTHQTVGTGLDITHHAATPVGMPVTVYAELRSFDKHQLVFDVRAEDAGGAIAQGQHIRMLASTASLDRMLRKKQGG